MTFDRHAFWKDPAGSTYPGPWTEHCRPEFYLDLVNVTRLIVDTVSKYATPDMTILELGCGTGRNLAGLYRAGFKNLAGVEINQNAVDLGLAAFPEYSQVNLTVSPVEDVFRTLPKYDVIFTQGFLMHLPRDYEWIISGLKEKAEKVIITNEGERYGSFHAWPHDYLGLIQSKTWRQVEIHSDEAYPPLPATTVKRVFLRKDD